MSYFFISITKLNYINNYYRFIKMLKLVINNTKIITMIVDLIN